jgi:hypothetical protein
MSMNQTKTPMLNFFNRIYGSQPGEKLREVAPPTYCVAQDAERCCEVLLMTLPDDVKALPQKLIVSREIPFPKTEANQ